MIGRAPRYRVTAILRWACQLRVPGVGDESQQQGEEEHVQDNNVIDPLVDLLLTLYPPIEKRVAACLLLAAVMTESLGRVMLVLHHVCPHIASYGDDKAMALIRGVGGRAEQQEEQDQERVDRLVEQGVALIPHRTTGGKVITALHMAAQSGAALAVGALVGGVPEADDRRVRVGVVGVRSVWVVLRRRRDGESIALRTGRLRGGTG